MTVISRRASVEYSVSDMYALVDDISTYPDFLPWCKAARVQLRSEDEVRASIEIAQAAFKKSFTISHHLQKNKMIEMRLVQGPFRHFQGFWRFDPVENGGCRISFDLEFKFSNPIMGLAAGPLFSQIADALVDAFVLRARHVYGVDALS